MPLGADAVAAFSSDVQDLANEPVSTRRHGQTWTVQVRVRSARWFTAEGFGFSERELRLGRRTARLGDETLQIVEVSVAGSNLRVLIRQAKEVLAAADHEAATAERVLADAARVLRSLEHDPVRLVFARRALRGIGHLAADATTEAIAAATGSSTDTEVVVRALEQPEALARLTETDPLAGAKVRGLRARERLLRAEGGTWDTPQVAEHLHLTRQGVNRRRQAGTLLAVDVGRRGYRYPAWQFVRGGTLRGLEKVLESLRPHDAWMQMSFMLTPNARLDGEIPLAALKAGQIDEVRVAAEAFGEHGAA